MSMTKSGLYVEYIDPPSMKDDKFIEDFTNTFDKASLNYENVLVLGDLNYNMQDGEKSSPLQSVCDMFDYSNSAKKKRLASLKMHHLP